MRPDWLEYLVCLAYRGHAFDATGGAHTVLSRHHSRYGDSDKTRCLWCQAERYIQPTRQGRRWIR